MDEANKTLAVEKKDLGNAAFKAGKYDEALALFTEGIEMDPSNQNLFCNRAMTNFSLCNWDMTANDAKRALMLSDVYVKAYFWLIKAQMEKQMFREAKLWLLNAFNKCGDCAEFKGLEAILVEKTGSPLRPKPTDFEVLEELGTGNFTKIFAAEYRPTKQLYAMKVIEKQNIERMKRRHRNINNEILMEKRALNKMDHPNVVTLYSTFQDYGTLYYQMELCTGGEVWCSINDKGTVCMILMKMYSLLCISLHVSSQSRCFVPVFNTPCRVKYPLC